MKEKLKNLSKQTIIYGTSTVAGRFLNFILVPFYTNVFPPSEYGIVAVIFAYTAFFNIIYSLGLESGYFRYASSPEIGDNKQNFSHPFFGILLNSLILSVVIFLSTSWISAITGIRADFIRYTSGILFFDALVQVPFAYLRLRNKALLFAAIKIFNIVINISGNLILILVAGMGLEAVFISNLAASFITFLLLLPVITGNISFKYNEKLFSELLKFSLPYLPAGLAAMLIQVIDKPLMQYLTDVRTVGIYNANYKLGIFMMLVVSMFEYAWRPFFLNNMNEPDAKEMFSKVMTAFTGICSVIFIILSMFIEDIVKIPLPFKGYLIGEQYWSGVTIVPVVLLSYIFLGMYTNFISGIYIEKKTRYLPQITGLGAFLNIIFCFLLIPAIGITGGALATLVSYLVMAIHVYLVSQRFYKVNYELAKLFAVMLVNLVTIILFYLTYNQGLFVIKATVSVVLSGLVVYITKLYKAGYLLARNN